MTDATAAQLIALGVLALISVALVRIRRNVYVASVVFTYTSVDGVSHTVQKGAVIPAGDVSLVPAGSYTVVNLSALRSLIVGADNRTSTSKTIVFAWTYAIAFGIISLIVAKWLGSSEGYDNLVNSGLREEYWLFLGGSYAAAVLAKYSATTQAPGSGKPAAGVGGASVAQLVTNDQGNGDIGDFQYVLFNAITLVVYLGEFVPHLGEGLPHLPSFLTGLALTSAGGYSAKKLLQQQGPTLTSVLPGTITLPAAGGMATKVELWGSNLIVPADLAPSGSPLPPTVMVGGQVVPVIASEEILGVDHVTVGLSPPAPTGLVKLTAVRADGIAATAQGGADGLPLIVSAPA